MNRWKSILGWALVGFTIMAAIGMVAADFVPGEKNVFYARGTFGDSMMNKRLTVALFGYGPFGFICGVMLATARKR